ncbi:ATP-binding protein [Methylobacterium durans]|uniref:ATP-binding protein n=1 Tax=Methylobacterium durans TaxID=2202825 RepID=UPI002AFEFF41|nr:ATP-binding protein [Methylobacterium durans]MEA1831515.1 ATP-binding protein [Methylobacterium durans]
MFALVLTLPLLGILTFVTSRFIQSERSKLEGVSIEANIDLGLLVERDLITLIAALKALGASPIVDNDIARFRHQGREALAGRPGELMLLDRAGRDLLAEGGPHWVPEVLRPSAATWAQEPGHVSISDLLPYVPGRGRQVTVSLPVSSPSGERYVLLFAVQPSHFTALMQSARLAPPHFGALVDRTGAMIARTVESDRFMGTRVTDLSAMEGATGRVDATNVGGVEVRRFYRRSPISGWYVLTSVSHAALQKSTRQSLWLLAAVAASLMLIAVPCAVILTRRMRYAARLTKEAAHQLVRGEPIDRRSTGIAESDMVCHILAEASDRLRDQAESLRSTNQDLERRVADRTRELADSHVLTESILENSPDIIKVLDVRGRVIFSNERCRTLHGEDPRVAAKGRLWSTFWPGEGGKAAREAIALAQRGRPSRFTAWRRAESGEQHWLDVLVTPMVGADGLTRRILAISRDVTAHHARDEELQVAKERAEAASIAKADFLATMSHELRTPLNGILGYADLLGSDRTLSQSQSRRISRIQDAASGLLRIVNDILDLAKIEAGDVTLELRPFSLKDLVEKASAIVMPMAQAKHLVLDIEIQDGLPPALLGDPDRLKQIMLNLLGNAIKFTETGRVVLRAEAPPATDGRCRLTIQITDTGIGIPAELQHLLFQRFSQVDAGSERRFGGAGLGLAISRHLIEQMGGRIEVESALGTGSTFRLDLDLAVADMSTGPAEDVPLACSAFEANVLVVEDISLNRELIGELLTALGASVDIVSSGEEAIAAVQAKSYDLVLMDEQMPGMSGSAATRIIRSLDHPSHDVPVIACSADVLSHHLRRFEEAGMNGHVGKPLTQAALAKVLIRYAFRLRTQPVRREAPLPVVASPEASTSGRHWLSEERLDAARGNLREDIRILRDTIRAGDYEAAACKAHAMISTACILDFPGLSKAAQSFEAACKGGAPDGPERAHFLACLDETVAAIGEARAAQRARIIVVPETAAPPAEAPAEPDGGVIASSYPTSLMKRLRSRAGDRP